MFWWFSGNDKRRHHFYGSIPVHRKWNYFCLAGGKATTKASLLGVLSHTRLTGKVFHLMTMQVVNSTWTLFFFFFGTFPWLANFESSDLAIWPPYVKICVKSTSKKSDQFIKLGWWLIVSNPNEPLFFFCFLSEHWIFTMQVAEVKGQDVSCVVKNSATLSGSLFTLHVSQIRIDLPTLSDADKDVSSVCSKLVSI